MGALVALRRTWVHPKERVRELLKKLKGAPAQMLWCLWSHAGADDCCWPSLQTMADECGLGLSTARAAIATLEKEGLVERRLRVSQTTVYRFTLYDEVPASQLAPTRQPIGGVPASQLALIRQPAGAKVSCSEGLSNEDNSIEPAAHPPEASPSGVGCDDPPAKLALVPKKKIGLKRKKTFAPEVHEFVRKFREDFKDNVQRDYEWDSPTDHELNEARKLMAEASPQELQREKEWIMTDLVDPPQGTWTGWAYVVRSVSGWRAKRVKIRNAMKGRRF